MRASAIIRGLNAPKTLPLPVPETVGLLAKGKALVKFYKAGITNVWHNRRAAAEIRRQYKALSGLDLARAVMERANINKIQKGVAKRPVQPVAVTRDQLLTVLRTERDWPKLPAFAVVFAVFFELTPLLLILFPRIAPTTCYSANFRAKEVAAYRRRQAGLQRFEPAFSASVHCLSADEARALAQTVLPHAPVLTAYMPISWIRNRLRDHLIWIRADDALLRAEKDPLEIMLPEELERACMARAIPLGSVSKQLSDLEKWLAEFAEPADLGFFFKQ